MAAVVEGGPPADIKAKCKKVQVVKGYALDPAEPHIIITYREDWRDPTQKDPTTGKALTLFSEVKTKRVKLSTFKANSDVNKFAAAAQKNADSLIPDVERIKPYLKQLAERLGGPPASATSPTATAAVSRPPTAPQTPQTPVTPQPVAAAAPVVVAPKEKPQPKYLTPVVIQAPAKVAAKVVTPTATAPAAAATPVATAPITSPPAKAPAKVVPGQPLNVDDDDDDLSSMAAVGSAAAAPPAPKGPTEAEIKEREAAAYAKALADVEKKRLDDEKEKKAAKKKAKLEKEKKAADAAAKAAKAKPLKPVAPAEKANIRDVESYTEKLYEGVDEKVKGTAMLLQLVQKPEHLDYFVQSEATLNTLSRVLTEDMKRSTVLVTNILEIFFCFSSFTQLHNILISNKIGDATLKIIDMEIKRYEGKFTEDGKADKTIDIKKDPVRLEKQERLLFVCFYILLNLAEDTSIEVKMKKRKIVIHLCRMLKRKNKDRKFLDELHLLIITFLKKLSIFTENKEEMVKSGILEKLRPFLKTTNEELLEAVLRLLFNLSFDSTLRTAIATMDWLHDFVACLHRDNCRLAAMKLLYNLSADDNIRPAVEAAMLPVMPLMSNLIRNQARFIEQELAALTLNVTVASTQCVEAFCSSGDGLFHLIKRVSQTLDPLGMKLIRNMSQQPITHKLLARHGLELVDMAIRSQVQSQTQAPSSEFFVEALGTLNNIQVHDCGYATWIQTSKDGGHHSHRIDFLNLLVSHLIGGDDDIVLEVVMLLGTVALDSRSGAILASRALLQNLYNTLCDKVDDVEIVLQTMFTLYRFLMQDHTREAVIEHKQLPYCMLNLVVDPHPEIRNLANQSLDIIMDHDQSWRDRIRDKRFEACNAEWLQFITQNGNGGGGGGMDGSPGYDSRGRSHTPGSPGSHEDYDDDQHYDQYSMGRSDPTGRNLFEDNHDMRDLDEEDSMDVRHAPPGMGYDPRASNPPRTPDSPSESMSPR